MTPSLSPRRVAVAALCGAAVLVVFLVLRRRAPEERIDANPDGAIYYSGPKKRLGGDVYADSEGRVYSAQGAADAARRLVPPTR